ncbi:MAG: L-aspartate oxidase [Sarcina sp.]
MRIYDVVIVGSGVAGLFTALNLHKNINVMIITKKTLTKCNSYLAQGGIAVLKNEEDFEGYVEDTMRAGRYKNNKDAVKFMINKSREIVEDLVDLKVNFDKEGENFRYTKEGAHSNERILHHEDLTGKEIVKKLIEEVKKRKNISFEENCKMIDIIKEDKSVVGIVTKKQSNYERIFAKKVVLATGGIGGLFKNTTNFDHIKGDGISIAIKNEIRTKDLKYVQIHPTALYIEGAKRRFLVSEAVRGEGAYLLNKEGERFVDELLPRDVVSSKILDEMEKSGEKCLYLSLAHRGEDFAKKRFPNIYRKCLKHGYNLGVDRIPIAPAQHYFMGGIEIDLEGKTSLENLYAVGETSCIGVHGANRLASNSLLDALVFAKEAGKSINKELKQRGVYMNYIPKEEERTYKEREKNIIKDIIKKENLEFYKKWIK